MPPPFSCHRTLINYLTNPPWALHGMVRSMCGKWHLWGSFVVSYSGQVECEPLVWSAITLHWNVCTLLRRTGNTSYKWLTAPVAFWDCREIILCICNAYIELGDLFLWFSLTSYFVGKLCLWMFVNEAFQVSCFSWQNRKYQTTHWKRKSVVVETNKLNVQN